MPLPLHQFADPALTAEAVLSTFAATDGECSFDEARQIAERCNQHGGNLTKACPGWDRSLYHPFLAYANALLCERDPAELKAWLLTCAADLDVSAYSSEREADAWAKSRNRAEAAIREPICREMAARKRAEAAAFRHRAAVVDLPSVETMFRASVALIGEAV